MKINNEIVGKDINVAKFEGPFVGYNNELVGYILKKYFCVKRREDIILGKVLSMFGYTKDDNILLTNTVYKDNEVIIDYMVNGVYDEKNKIKIKFDKWICDYRMIINDDEKMEVSCQISVFSKRDISFRVAKITEKLENGRIYSREFNTYCAKYSILVGDTYIDLHLGIEIPNAGYVNPPIFILENEKSLEDYFKNIDISKGMDDIYRDVLSYFSNIFEYLDIKLCVKKINSLVNAQDIIHVKNGICEGFKVIRGNKCVVIDKVGNAEYQYNDEFVKMVTSVNVNENASYTIQASNDIVLSEQVFVNGVQGYEKSIDEIDNVKERVLRLVPKRY